MNSRRPLAMHLTPWYKQPGPWILIGTFGGIVIVGILALYLVSRQSNTPTAADYLNNSPELDAFVEERQRAQLRGISAVLNFGDESVSVGTTGPVAENKLKLILSHPREPGSDVTITLHKVTEGLFTGDMPSPISAGWNWSLRGSEGEDWQLNGEVYIDDLGYELPPKSE